MEKLTKVSIGYIDYPSIDGQSAWSIYGSIMNVIDPIKKAKDFWALDGKTIEIEPTTKEEIDEAFEEHFFEVDPDDDDCGIVQLEFENGPRLLINSYDETYKWREPHTPTRKEDS